MVIRCWLTFWDALLLPRRVDESTVQPTGRSKQGWQQFISSHFHFLSFCVRHRPPPIAMLMFSLWCQGDCLYNNGTIFQTIAKCMRGMYRKIRIHTVRCCKMTSSSISSSPLFVLPIGLGFTCACECVHAFVRLCSIQQSGDCVSLYFSHSLCYRSISHLITPVAPLPSRPSGAPSLSQVYSHHQCRAGGVAADCPQHSPTGRCH